MNFDDLLGPDAVVVALRVENRWDAIEELINHLVTRQKIKPEHKGAISTAVKERESSMSTGIGHGVGLPHATTELISDVLVAVGRSRKGMPFDALDDKPVHLVILFIVPKGALQKHLNTLTNLAKLLGNDDFRKGFWSRFE